MKSHLTVLCGIALFASLGGLSPAFAGLESRATHSEPEDRQRASFLAIKPSMNQSKSVTDSRNALRSSTVEIQFEALRELAGSSEGGRPNVVIEPFEGARVEIDGESLFINESATMVGRLTEGESGIFILS